MKYYELKAQWLEESKAIEEYNALPFWKKWFTSKPVSTITERDLDKEGERVANTFRGVWNSVHILEVRYSPYYKRFSVYYEELDFPTHVCVEVDLDKNGEAIDTSTRLGCEYKFLNSKRIEEFNNLLSELQKALKQ